VLAILREGTNDGKDITTVFKAADNEEECCGNTILYVSFQ